MCPQQRFPLVSPVSPKVAAQLARTVCPTAYSRQVTLPKKRSLPAQKNGHYHPVACRGMMMPGAIA